MKHLIRLIQSIYIVSFLFFSRKPPNYFYILTEDSQMYNVSQVIPHPTFQETTRKHDIGLLKLSVNITLPDFVISCSQPPPNVEIRIYGRGTYFGVESLVFLQEAYGRTLRDFDCKRIFPSLSSKEYCAASPWHCSIESGSPILSQGKLIGVVGAIRNPCSNDPFIYTKLNEYVSWIRMQNSNFRCDYV